MFSDYTQPIEIKDFFKDRILDGPGKEMSSTSWEGKKERPEKPKLRNWKLQRGLDIEIISQDI